MGSRGFRILRVRCVLAQRDECLYDTRLVVVLPAREERKGKVFVHRNDETGNL